MPRAADQLGIVLALALLAAPVHSQFRDVPPPPRLDSPETTSTPPPAEPQPPPREIAPLLEQLRAARPPNAARLAPLPEERADQPSERDKPDEVIVIGSGWRLPDLGSDWRAQQEAENPRAL